MYCKGKARASVHPLQPSAVWGCCFCRTSLGKAKRKSYPATCFMHLVAALLHVITSISLALWKKHGFRDPYILHLFAPCLHKWQQTSLQKKVQEESSRMPHSITAIFDSLCLLSSLTNPSASSVLDPGSNIWPVAGVLVRGLHWALFLLGTSGH